MERLASLGERVEDDRMKDDRTRLDSNYYEGSATTTFCMTEIYLQIA